MNPPNDPNEGIAWEDNVLIQESLDDALQQKRSGWRVGVAATSFIVVIVFISVVLRPLAQSLFMAPTSSPATEPIVQIIAPTNYGTIAVNGKPYPLQTHILIKITQGVNTIVVRAAPYPTYSCTLHFKVKSSDNCIVDTNETGFVTSLIIPLLPQQLPSEQQVAVRSQISTTIEAIRQQLTALIPTGAWYKTANNSFIIGLPVQQQASMPLRETVVLHDVAQPNTDRCYLNVCVGYSTAFVNSSLQAITYDISFLYGWQITDSNGTILVNTQSNPISQVEVPVTLTYSTDHGWQLANQSLLTITLQNMQAQLATQECRFGQHLVLSQGIDNNSTTTGFNIESGPQSTFSQCTFSVVEYNNDGTFVANRGTFIYQFGALLAADAAAHIALPSLPTITP